MPMKLHELCCMVFTKTCCGVEKRPDTRPAETLTREEVTNAWVGAEQTSPAIVQQRTYNAMTHSQGYCFTL